MLQNCDLPGDVLVVILLKLPIKSLLRCKTVCKSCYASAETFLIIENDKCDEAELPFMFAYKSSLQDSCNGLVCLSVNDGDRSRIILWNPATRKHRAIGVPHSFTDYLNYIGLGFSPELDDYKIIWIPSSSVRTPENYSEMNLWVYSLRSGSWKMVEILPYAYYLWPPTSINGCMHWITCNQSAEDRILTIDLCSDRLQYLDLPFSFHSSIDNSIALAVINGSLSAVISLEVEGMSKHFEVWVMAEYGVKDSWTRRFVVGPFSYISRPVGSWRERKLLFIDYVEEEDKFLSCDIFTNVVDFECSVFIAFHP
ncbi:hypothetical protein DH2020_010831 [Rehmannia glutinosa]|uniref:F-box protein n=1 Tax=Rehmannia glutinosa TaxID=99300 RepID=A0ABR0XBP7_REHGL